MLSTLLVTIATFLIVQILPGDPALLILGTEASPAAYAKLRVDLDLEQPWYARYYAWLKSFFQGDLGLSWRYNLPVRKLIAEAVPLSFGLAVAAVVFTVAISVPIGVYLAIRPHSKLACLLNILCQFGMAVPQFWLGLVLIQFFAVQLRLLPAGGNADFSSFFLPVLTLTIPRAAVMTRFVQVGLVEVLWQDYIRTARSKGVSWKTVLYKHALRNGALDVLTVAGLQFAQLLAGTIVVEQVFGLPGLGQLILAGVLQRDLPLVQALVTISIIAILLINLIIDFLLGILDPRLRYE